MLEGCLEELRDLISLERRYAKYLLDPQNVERMDFLLIPELIDLVDGDENRLFRALEPLGDFHVIDVDADLPIDDEDHRVGLFDRNLGLLLHQLGKRDGSGKVDSPCVDQNEGTAK